MKEIAFVHRPPTGQEMEALRLVLSSYQDGSGMLQESYGTFGQLKYYPLASQAIWSSNEFELENLPDTKLEVGALSYFPQLSDLLPDIFPR